LGNAWLKVSGVHLHRNVIEGKGGQLLNDLLLASELHSLKREL
jgi:hypothetical protein